MLVRQISPKVDVVCKTPFTLHRHKTVCITRYARPLALVPAHPYWHCSIRRPPPLIGTGRAASFHHLLSGSMIDLLALHLRLHISGLGQHTTTLLVQWTFLAATQ